MNKSLTKVVLLLIFFSTAFAGAIVVNFDVQTEGENVAVTWRTGVEDNVQKYVVLRRGAGTISGHNEIKTLPAKGSYSTYEFIDESAYKTNEPDFFYMIKIVDNDGNVSYTSEKGVSPNISSVKKTWGQIKAMFR